jgi:diguanylate cyclase (GGDEF)-like protein
MTTGASSIADLQATIEQLEAELSRAHGLLAELTRLLALTKEKFELLSRTDELTGLANRRYLLERLRQEIYRAQRYGSPLCVLMLDLDHFKQVNDTHGHLVGDQVLAAVGRLTRGVIRTSDIAGRYGGEEFCVIMPETDAAGARVFAERLREHLASEAHAGTQGQPVHVTCSIGIGELSPRTQDLKELLAVADSALYRAKDAGRNCVCAPEPLPGDLSSV